MKEAKLQAATVGGTPDDVEQAFYEALHNADIQQLMACWAEEDEIVCVHPGGPRLIGAGAIRQAFENMVSNACRMAPAPINRGPPGCTQTISSSSAQHAISC